MNKLTKKSFFSFVDKAAGSTSPSTVSSSPSSSETTARPKPVAYEVFKDHWKQATHIFSKSLINDDDIQIVKNNLIQMVNLLLDEMNNPNDYLSLKPLAFMEPNARAKSQEKTDYGPIWNYLFANNIFETIFLWSLSYPEYLFDLKYEQLKYYENLVYQMQTNEQTHLLLNVEIHRPLFTLLNHCSTHNSEQIERLMISILNQLCVCICKNANLLEIFFEQAKKSNSNNNSNNSSFYVNENGSSHQQQSAVEHNPYKFTTHFSDHRQYIQQTSSARFFIFSLLIPYIHKEGALGQQARDALLMIMQLSMRNSNLARYIVDSTDFCPILATGLSGLYSELPQKLTSNENFDEIRYLKKEDIMSIHSLNKFINSLEFCNNVIQVSHSLIANQLLQYVYYGFLVPVIAPALTQNCIDEIIAATAYLDLFLRTVTEPNLRRIFLKFVLYAKFDEKMTLLDTLINRINSNTKLSLVTLMLFYTMIDFNSEDVMYRLILVYLLPCNHLMKSQILTLKENTQETDGANASTFLSFATSHNKQVWLESVKNSLSFNGSLASVINQREPSSFSRWFYTLFESADMGSTVNYLDGSHFNFVDYLKDAQQGISNSIQISLGWSSFYDTPNSQLSIDSSATNSETGRQTPLQKNNMGPSPDLENDAEEYLLNLNIFASGLNDPVRGKSEHVTQNLFDPIGIEDEGSNSIEESTKSTATIRQEQKTNHRRSKIKKQNSSSESTKKKKKNRRERANDFYFLSFDNELSDSSPDSGSSDSDAEKTGSKSDNLDDDELTASMTSRSSSATLNNDEPEIISAEHRQKLIEYLFANEENNRSFLNGNLSSFLEALDAFFAQIKLNENAHDSKSPTDLSTICDQIMSIYNELLTVQSSAKEEKSAGQVAEETKEEEGMAIEPKQEAITHFPAYPVTGSDVSNRSSTHSLNEQSTEPDSGCGAGESCASSLVLPSPAIEADIGPFLTALFARMDHMLSNPLHINFLLTGIFARLAYYPQLVLRSYLLNHNLVVQPNVKTLIQVLGNIKYKIDACSQSFNNFPLLYFRAKVCLVKRIFEIKQKPKQLKQIPTSPQEAAKSMSEIRFRDIVRKKSTFDRFIDFFKPDEENNNMNNSNHKKQESSMKQIEIETEMADPRSEDINSNATTSSSDSTDARPANNIVNDFTLVEAEWENCETRNIAYSAVIFDEFVKELAAICQEHGLLYHD